MSQQEQVKINYEAFKKLLPELLRSEAGKQALMRDEQLIATYDTLADAVTTAQAMFPDGRWSIQQITLRPVDLGFRSRAVSVG
jgi:hypothetical protein